ncbi:MAG TPA: D-alanyl-D-alanine carboxypeptidase [Pseudolabrys sp.]
MLRAGALVRFCWGIPCGAVGLATLLAVTAITTDANARGRHHRHHVQAAEGYEPSYSSIVVDANSGAVMQATNADSPRHPASLTKIMTLYLLFERLDAGKIKLTAEMPVSSHAASMAPSKLGLLPGQTIDVETAIRAIVTKSANDVAVVVAEALGGDENNFGKMMTAKARALGMMHTNYHNASGLPDELQMSTARDQAILGRAIQDRFPKFYNYFSTRYFAFHGHMIRNHNHLLGSVPGLDGIKTGYIHDSGFNIVTSVRRNGRHIVAVVFGGHTAAARDARVLSLIDNNINIASLKRTAPPMIDDKETAEVRAKEIKGAKESAAKETKEKTASAAPSPGQPALGSTDPIKPNSVKTFAVQLGTMRTASLSPLPSSSRKLMLAPANSKPITVTNVSIAKRDVPAPPEEKPHSLGVLPGKLASASANVPITSVMPGPKARGGGWLIQVGAFPEENEAKQRLTAAQEKAKEQLGQANPFTERTTKGDKAMFRARFAGLDKDQAETACKHLKHSEIPCMVLKN